MKTGKFVHTKEFYVVVAADSADAATATKKRTVQSDLIG